MVVLLVAFYKNMKEGINKVVSKNDVTSNQAKQSRKDNSSIIILKSARLEFYLFRKPLQAPLRPVRVLDGVPVADTEQHLELRLRGRAPSAGTKISNCLLPDLYVAWQVHDMAWHACIACSSAGMWGKQVSATVGNGVCYMCVSGLYGWS